jgi:hypothetical protein
MQQGIIIHGLKHVVLSLDPRTLHLRSAILNVSRASSPGVDWVLRRGTGGIICVRCRGAVLLAAYNVEVLA